MESIISINFSNYTNTLIEVIKALSEIGWKSLNSVGRREYLPIGDDDKFDWQSEMISEDEFYQIIEEKCKRKEQIGVNLFFNSCEYGISLIAVETKNVNLGLSINRKTIEGGYTDVVWYVENIIYKLIKNKVNLTSYTIEEYDD